jgi:type IV secretion system protein VirB5
MKQTLFKVVAVIGLSSTLLGQAWASGVPTVDAVANALFMDETIARAQDAAAAIAKYEQIISQAKYQFDQTKAMVTGKSTYSPTFNTGDLIDYLPVDTGEHGWERVYSDVPSGTIPTMRKEYGLTSEDPVVQEAYDKRLITLYRMQQSYAANNKRIQGLKSLQAQADLAETPQQKMDIANRIATEGAAINNESNRIASVQSITAQQKELDVDKQNASFNKWFSSGGK